MRDIGHDYEGVGQMKQIIDLRLKVTKCDNGGYVVDWADYCSEFPKKFSGLACFQTMMEAISYAEGVFGGNAANGIFRRFFGKRLWR